MVGYYTQTPYRALFYRPKVPTISNA